MKPFLAGFLLETWWAGPLLWALAYVSDYVLTVTCAARYKAQDKIVFEGSYELNPIFVKDINALRAVSPRFVVSLAVSTLYLVLVERTIGQYPGVQNVYLGILGGMLGIQMTVHVRHLRNWFLLTRGVPLLRGRLEYPRAYMLRASAHECWLFSALFAIAFAVSGSAFLLGASFACGFVAINHLVLARRHDKASGRAGVPLSADR